MLAGAQGGSGCVYTHRNSEMHHVTVGIVPTEYFVGSALSCWAEIFACMHHL